MTTPDVPHGSEPTNGSGAGPRDYAPDTSPSDTVSMWRTASRFSYVGIFFGVAIVVGFFAGRWIETKWGHAPAPSLIGVFVGIAAGFRELYRIAKSVRGT